MKRPMMLAGIAFLTLAACQKRHAESIDVVNTDGGLELSSPMERVHLFALVKDQYGAAMPNRKLLWSSSDPSVVQVTREGVLRPLADGRAVVRVSTDRVSTEQPVTVRFYLTLVPSEQELELTAGDTHRLAAKIIGTGGSPIDHPVAWVSLDPKIAVVDAEGNVTGVSPGFARIRVSAKHLSRSIGVFVAPAPAAPTPAT